MMIANGSPHDQNEPHYTNLISNTAAWVAAFAAPAPVVLVVVAALVVVVVLARKVSLMVPKLGHKMI